MFFFFLQWQRRPLKHNQIWTMFGLSKNKDLSTLIDSDFLWGHYKEPLSCVYDHYRFSAVKAQQLVWFCYADLATLDHNKLPSKAKMQTQSHQSPLVRLTMHRQAFKLKGCLKTYFIFVVWLVDSSIAEMAYSRLMYLTWSNDKPF